MLKATVNMTGAFMGHSELSHLPGAHPQGAALKCRICGCKLNAAQGDDAARGVCAACDRRPEARRLGQTPPARASGAAAPARAFTPAELSLLQRRLTERTHNVTMIFDCCYAAQMSRTAAALEARPR